MATENTQPTAVVAGGGPSGALTAKVLAERGFKVSEVATAAESRPVHHSASPFAHLCRPFFRCPNNKLSKVCLFEAYPNPADGNDGKAEKSKAYVIALNARGQLALKRCGVDPFTDIDAAVISEAVVRHDANGKATVIKPTNPSVHVKRRDLASSLLRAAEKAGAEVHCGWGLTAVDFEKQQVTLVEKDSSAEKVVGYDLLVGADGVHSKVRKFLSNYVNERGEDFVVKEAPDTVEYQVAVMPKPWRDLILPDNASSHPLDKCPAASVHAYADAKLGTSSLSFPLRDSSKSPIDKHLVCVICPGGMLGDMKKAGVAGYSSALSALFSDWKPDARSELARQLAEDDNIPSNGGVCVWSQALSSPEAGVVLIGDAGHGMWPSLGQGCNAALESVSGECNPSLICKIPVARIIGSQKMLTTNLLRCEQTSIC